LVDKEYSSIKAFRRSQNGRREGFREGGRAKFMKTFEKQAKKDLGIEE